MNPLFVENQQDLSSQKKGIIQTKNIHPI